MAHESRATDRAVWRRFCVRLLPSAESSVVREVSGNELFRVATDRYEMRNLSGDPPYAAVISDLHLQLLVTDTDRADVEELGA